MDRAKYANGHFLTQSKLDTEVANLVYQKYVNESWWTRCSRAFLFLAGLCIVVLLAMLVMHVETTVAYWVVLGLGLPLLTAHIKSANRIHAEFEAGHPEEYAIWQNKK